MCECGPRHEAGGGIGDNGRGDGSGLVTSSGDIVISNANLTSLRRTGMFRCAASHHPGISFYGLLENQINFPSN